MSIIQLKIRNFITGMARPVLILGKYKHVLWPCESLSVKCEGTSASSRAHLHLHLHERSRFDSGADVETPRHASKGRCINGEA